MKESCGMGPAKPAEGKTPEGSGSGILSAGPRVGVPTVTANLAIWKEVGRFVPLGI